MGMRYASSVFDRECKLYVDTEIEAVATTSAIRTMLHAVYIPGTMSLTVTIQECGEGSFIAGEWWPDELIRSHT